MKVKGLNLDYLLKPSLLYCSNVYTVKQGVDFWGLTAQNEPWDGTVPDFTFNAMGWNATTQRDWIVEHLGPALEAAGYAGKV